MIGQRLIPVLFLVAGTAVIAAAISTGGASLFLVVVIPVVAGSSPLLFLGIALIVAGLMTLPLAFSPGDEAAPLPLADGRVRAPPPPPSTGGSGGLILLGPVPIFFGSWRNPGATRYWLAVLGGLVLLVVAVVLFVAWTR